MKNAQENLDLLSDVLQIYNTHLLLKDATNNEIMKELQKQDEVYFEKILKELKEIKIMLAKIKQHRIIIDRFKRPVSCFFHWR